VAGLKFSLRQDYPTSLARLWTALGHRGYVERKYRSLGTDAVRVLKFNATDEIIEVELQRSAPVAREKLPAWARPFVGHQQLICQHTRWRRVGPTHIEAELDLAPVGMQVHAHGVGSVVELSACRTRMTLRFDVQCTLPALGDKAARLFADQVREALRADHAFTQAYLAASSCLTAR
jgi:hypothetical protein